MEREGGREGVGGLRGERGRGARERRVTKYMERERKASDRLALQV